MKRASLAKTLEKEIRLKKIKSGYSNPRSHNLKFHHHLAKKNTILRKARIKTVTWIGIILFSLLISLFILGPRLTGLVIGEAESEYSIYEDIYFNQSGTYNLTPEEFGELSSMAISGEISIFGSVKISIEELTIFDSNRLTPEEINTSKTGKLVGALTGKITDGEVLVKEKQKEETPVEEKFKDKPVKKEKITIEEKPIATEDSTVKSQIEQTTTQETTTKEENQTIQPKEEEVVNQTSPQETTPSSTVETTTQPEKEKLTIEFTDYCQETCVIQNLNKLYYTINIEIENSSLALKKIKYRIRNPEKPIISNITEQQIENETIKIQGQIKIDEPVKWKKTIASTQKIEIIVSMPKSSRNIEVQKIPSDSTEVNYQIKEISTIQDKPFGKRLISTVQGETTTNINETIEIIINDNATEYEILYETTPPQKEETEISKLKKEIIISAADELNYTNILAFTNLTTESRLEEITLYHVNENKNIEFIGYDLNNNSLIDYIEWAVPHLSNQTYQITIIPITKALHLDQNKVALEDIYNALKSEDGITKIIPENDYVRITFEKNLTSENDITIYANSTNAIVEVYEKDSNIKIATFSEINEYGKYQIYLTELPFPQDTFDLKIINHDIEFDYIVDPSLVPSATFFEGFESNGFTVNNWILEQSNNPWEMYTAYPDPHTGSYFARAMPKGGASNITTSVNTQGYENITISLWAFTSGLDSGEGIALSWYDGLAWTQEMLIEDLYAWTQYSYNLSSAANNNPNFLIRVTCIGDHNNEYCSIDDLNISGTPIETLSPILINDIQCEENETWKNCNEVGFRETITNFRVNCTSPTNSIAQVNFKFLNLPDNNTFFMENSTSNVGDIWNYNNTYITINDSGEFLLNLTCLDNTSNSKFGNFSWTVPWGTLNSDLISPTNNINILQNNSFNFTSRVTCSGGECGDINATLDPLNWWNTSFKKRKTINITNAGTSQLSNFTAYMHIEIEPTMQTDLDDLKFISGSCTSSESNELSYEIESHNSSHANIWVKIPALTTGINSICIYYDSNTLISNGNSLTAWDSNYRMVHHFEETSGIEFDSTIYGLSGTSVGGVNQSAIGKIGVANKFDGTNYLNISQSLENWLGESSSMSFWIKTTDNSGEDNPWIAPAISGIELAGGANDIFWGWLDSSGHIGLLGYGDPNPAKSTTIITDGSWYYVGLTRNSSSGQVSVFVNGVLEHSLTSNIGVVTTPFSSIGQSEKTGNPIDATLDEVRISTSIRTLDWFNQSFQMIENSETFVSYGEEEDNSGKGVVPMNSGVPFYTTSQNPTGYIYDPCFSSMIDGDYCNTTWTVNATNPLNSSWEFFTIYESSNYNPDVLTNQTPSANITISTSQAVENMSVETNSIECEESGIWKNCSETNYGETITRVRANCTSTNSTITQVNFKLSNTPDGTTFFNSNYTSNLGNIWIYDNEDITINDSGEFLLNVTCADLSSHTNTNTSNWNIPWGTLIPTIVYPSNNSNLSQHNLFNLISEVTCSGGECGSLNATLDPPANWWDSAWDSRKEINITNGGASTLTNFPIYLNISIEPEMQSNLNDLRFIPGSCLSVSGTEMSFEIETYDSSSANLWIKIPSFSQGTNSFCMYYDNPVASSGQSITGAWDSNHIMVQHMNEASAATMLDSTANNNDVSSSTGTPTYGATGKISSAVTFDATGTDGLLVADSASLDITGPITLSAWVAPTTIAAYDRIVTKSFTTDVDPWTMYGLIFNDVNNLRLEISENIAGTQQSISGIVNISTTGWTYASSTWDGTSLRVYVNGILDSELVGTAVTLGTNNMDLAIGRSSFDNNYFTGTIDEVIVSNTSRSANWINQSYQLVQNQADLITTGPSEIYSLVSAKGVMPMNSGVPFYTTSQNPTTYLNSTCLQNMKGGDSCQTSWSVNSTGEIDSSWEFFTIYNAENYNLYVSSNQSLTNVYNIVDPSTLEPDSAQIEVYTNSMTDVSYGLNEGPLQTNVSVKFQATHSDNFARFVEPTAKIEFTKTGEDSRSTTCSRLTNESSGQSANYTCSVQMQFWDGPGVWNINASIQDDAINYYEENLQNFSIGATSGFIIAETNLTWDTLLPGSQNVQTNSSLLLKNTGNTIKGITINSTNLIGDIDPTKIIPAENFKISPDNNCNGTPMQNNLFILIENTTLNKGDYIQTENGKQSLYFCITSVPEDLTSQNYKTSQGAWIIKIFAILLTTRRKKLIKDTDKLIKKLEREKYLLENSIEDDEVGEIPINIFSKEIGALEIITKYMKENLGLTYSEIAANLNRNQKTIWCSYNNAIKKDSTPLKILKSSIKIPISKLQIKNLTVLEAIILYLRNSGIKYSEIGKLLDRDQRNVWTINNKLNEKLRI